MILILIHLPEDLYNWYVYDNFQQSQVTCYPERQIEEFTVKIDQLTKEYKAYVRKLRELEPGLTAVPWTDRAYDRKRKLQGVQKDVSQGTYINSYDFVYLKLIPKPFTGSIFLIINKNYS